MVILRIKQAEHALADGRLDEACSMVRESRVRAHRRGQELASRLLAALVRRGREHLAAGRLGDAHADATRAAELDAHHADVAALREAIGEGRTRREREHREREGAVAAARQCLDEGWLSGGARAIADLAEDCVERVGVEQAMAMEQARMQGVRRRAEAACAAGDWCAAAELLGALGSHRLADDALVSLARQVVQQAVAAAEADWQAGRLAAVRERLRIVEPLAGRRPEVAALRDALATAEQAATRIDRHEAHRASRLLRRLMVQYPEAAWLHDALTGAEQAAEAADGLAASPLAELMVGDPRDSAASGALEPGRGAAAAHRVNVAAEAVHTLPQRFLLQIDGVGTYLVVRSPHVRVGPAGGPAAVDVPLMADPRTPVVEIRRADEDYFLSSDSPVHVNRKPLRQALLSTGDRLALTRHAQLRFRLPHAASTTGVLELTAGRLSRADVRACLLLDREIVLGPAASAHVHVPDLAEPIVLRCSDERLTCIDGPAQAAGGRRDHDHVGQPLPQDTAVPLGPLTLRLQRF